jgi:hypothetical protein
MELVRLPVAVDHPDGVKADVLEIGDSSGLGNPGIEAPSAENLIAAIPRSAVYGVPRWRLVAALFATLLCHVVPAVTVLPAIAGRIGSGCRLRQCTSLLAATCSPTNPQWCARELAEPLLLF